MTGFGVVNECEKLSKEDRHIAPLFWKACEQLSLSSLKTEASDLCSV